MAGEQGKARGRRGTEAASKIHAAFLENVPGGPGKGLGGLLGMKKPLGLGRVRRAGVSMGE